MTTVNGQGEAPNALPAVPAVDIAGAKNRQTGLSTSDRYLYISSQLMKYTEIKSDDSMLTTVGKVISKVAIVLGTIATLPLVPFQALIGHSIHQHDLKNIKEFVDPILETLEKHPLTPASRKRIQSESGITVSLTVDPKKPHFVREYDRVLKAIDRDFVGQEVETQADKIVERLATMDPSKHAGAVKAIVEAVVNRTNMHEHLNVERKEEVAQDLYLAIQDKYLNSEASRVVSTLVEKSEITEFAGNVDALSNQIAEISQLSVEDARSVTHTAIREEIETAQVKIEDQSIEEYVTTSEEALKNVDTSRNQLEERIRLLKEGFESLVSEKDGLIDRAEDYKRDKTVAEMRDILSNELKDINKERETLRKDLKKAEGKVGKKLKKKSTTTKQKQALDEANQTKVKAFTQSLADLDVREKSIREQMLLTDEQIKTAPTPFDQRIQEIEVELTALTSQIKSNYTELENFVVNNAVKTEAFKRVMALISGKTDDIDYAKSLSNISRDLAAELVEETKDDLPDTTGYEKATLTDFDAFQKFFLSVDFGSSAARASLRIFTSREDMTVEQKDKLAELVGLAVGFEEDVVQNGHDYLIAYINGEELSNDVEVMPSIILDVMTSDEAKAATEFVAPVVVEEVEEVAEETVEAAPSYGTQLYNYFFPATAKA